MIVDHDSFVYGVDSQSSAQAAIWSILNWKRFKHHYTHNKPLLATHVPDIVINRLGGTKQVIYINKKNLETSGTSTS